MSEDDQQTETVLLLHSGGIGATSLLYWLIDSGHMVDAVTYHYGQSCEEMGRARVQCESLVGVSHRAVMVHGTGFVAEAKARLSGPDVVPNLALTILSHGVGRAIETGIRAVAVGVCAPDPAVAVRWRPEVVESYNSVIQLAHHAKIQLWTPYAGLNKTQVATLGRDLGAPVEDSWSCEVPHAAEHCRSCVACDSRKHALHDSRPNAPLVVPTNPEYYAEFYA